MYLYTSMYVCAVLDCVLVCSQIEMLLKTVVCLHWYDFYCLSPFCCSLLRTRALTGPRPHPFGYSDSPSGDRHSCVYIAGQGLCVHAVSASYLCEC